MSEVSNKEKVINILGSSIFENYNKLMKYDSELKSLEYSAITTEIDESDLINKINSKEIKENFVKYVNNELNNKILIQSNINFCENRCSTQDDDAIILRKKYEDFGRGGLEKNKSNEMMSIFSSLNSKLKVDDVQSKKTIECYKNCLIKTKLSQVITQRHFFHLKDYLIN